jgi:hypothetical protein
MRRVSIKHLANEYDSQFEKSWQKWGISWGKLASFFCYAANLLSFWLVI